MNHVPNYFVKFKQFLKRQRFEPTLFWGLWFNPYYLIRRGLLDGVKVISSHLPPNSILLDIGCGSKPYRGLFDVEEYIGIDIEISGHDHSDSQIDLYYDGKNIPFADSSFDFVFASEVIEHVFNLDELLQEIVRVLRPNGYVGLTCPFVWPEHEQPYDYARYTSFALQALASQHELDLVRCEPSNSFPEVIIQLINYYIYHKILPRNKYLKLLISPIFLGPLNTVGFLCRACFLKDKEFCNNYIVVMKKR